MSFMVKTRIAPSPTGYLHIGTARAALFSYLFAKQKRGHFVLRIEDTDRVRSSKDFEQSIIDGLSWLGLTWDEFYRQSERLDRYKIYLEKLLKEHRAYFCYCIKEESEGVEKKYGIAAKVLHLGMTEGKDFFYDEVPKEFKKNNEYIIRFRVEREIEKKSGPFQTESFEDIVRGRLFFPINTIEDFSIAKSINEPLFNFANVIDDEEMAITHVIRGEDHIPNTPKHVLLRKALGFESEMLYAHLPLVLGKDKSKLSKRHGATSLIEFKEQGYLPEAMINMMAFLGWNPGDEREFFTVDELIKEFSLERVKKGGAVFDLDRLVFLNQHYLRTLPVETLIDRLRPFVQALYGEDVIESFKKLKEVVLLERERATTLKELAASLDLFIKLPSYEGRLLVWKDQSVKDVENALTTARGVIEQIGDKEYTKDTIQELLMAKAPQGDRGKLLWPLRVALSGKKASPGPFDIAFILGKEETLNRIDYARKLVAS